MRIKLLYALALLPASSNALINEPGNPYADLSKMPPEYRASLDKSIGKLQLMILDWYCAQEHAESHASTLPCENYAGMIKIKSCKSKSCQDAIRADIAASRRSAGNKEELTRLVKAHYKAMLESYCTVPAHLLACHDITFKKEYDNLAAAKVRPAEALDRKAYHALTVQAKKQAKGEATTTRAKAHDPYLSRMLRRLEDEEEVVEYKRELRS